MRLHTQTSALFRQRDWHLQNKLWASQASTLCPCRGRVEKTPCPLARLRSRYWVQKWRSRQHAKVKYVQVIRLSALSRQIPSSGSSAPRSRLRALQRFVRILSAMFGYEVEVPVHVPPTCCPHDHSSPSSVHPPCFKLKPILPYLVPFSKLCEASSCFKIMG